MTGKPIIRNFNVHGLVRIRMETSSLVTIRQAMHQLAEFEAVVEHEYVPDVEIRDYAEIPTLKNPVVISDYYYYADGWLNIPAHRTCFNLERPTITIYCERPVLPVNLLVHLALLRKGHSLIHAAGVELGGKRFLFPAFGGVGKTTLVAALVFSGGKLYGDDLVIVNNKEMRNYPIDFSVYPYHLMILKLEDRVIARKFRMTAILNRITDVFEQYHWLPIRLGRIALNSLKTPYVNVGPRRIFGEQCLAEQGVLDGIYYLSRTNTECKELRVEPIDPDLLAKVATNILLHEWHQSLQYLYAYSGLSPFSVQQMYNDTRDVLGRLFVSGPCYSIRIPTSMTADDYQRALVKQLKMHISAVVGVPA